MIDVMEYQDFIKVWARKKGKELGRYGMTEEDFLNDFWIKWNTHKGKIIESQRIHNRNEGAFISLLCNRHLIDLRRKYVKKKCISIDIEVFEGSGESLADSLEDTRGMDLSLLFEMRDNIPNRKASRKVSYKEVFQIFLDGGGEPIKLAERLKVSRARISQITQTLMGYLKE